MLRHFGIQRRLLALLGVACLTVAALAGADLLVLRQTILQEREAKLRDMVTVAERLVAATDERARLAGGTTEQARTLAAGELRAMRWGDGDYYGVYQWDGLTVVHANPRYEGVNRLGYLDPTGKRLVAEIIDIAKAGHGVSTYAVPRAGGKEALSKLTFVGRYEPWRWAIQAGVYLDDVNATLRARALRLGAIGLAILAAAALAVWRVSRSIRFYQATTQRAVEGEAQASRRSEQRFRALIQNASDVVLICASDAVVSYHSPAAETAWGYDAAALLGQSFLGLIHPDDEPACRKLWQQVQEAPGAAASIALRLRDQAGAWRHAELVVSNLLHEPAIDGVVVNARDIEERKAFEQRLAQQAFFDSLTGLPNRALFRNRLDQALARAGRRQGRVGLLFLDLDNFKLINDSLGHQIGDDLLVQAGKRLQACVRSEDTVARLGGDEFVVLLEQVAGETDARAVADSITERFTQAFALEGRDFVVTASIGIAVSDAFQGSPCRGSPRQENSCQESADSLLRNADTAMYRAKSSGKGHHVAFIPSMHSNTISRLELEGELRRAVTNGELRVHYQPIVAMPADRVVEFEALVRWQHPSRGLMAPADFISLAEETGLIVPLGQWVLEQACRQAATWNLQFPGASPLCIGVNLSPRQFQLPALADEVMRALRESGLPPSCLKLEITESVIMQDVEAAIATLQRLKALGIRIAVDDFGAGHSSLTYLKRLPLDALKIDRAFITNIAQDQQDRKIVQAIIWLAKSLGLSVIAEGIETAEQADLLDAWGCDFGQGYHFGKPLGPAGAAALLGTADPDGPGVMRDGVLRHSSAENQIFQAA